MPPFDFSKWTVVAQMLILECFTFVCNKMYLFFEKCIDIGHYRSDPYLVSTHTFLCLGGKKQIL